MAPRWRPAAQDGDAGYVLLWVAVLLPVLCGAAALTVDVGQWYLTAVREQKAADAAALAAVAFLPGNPARAYQTVAESAIRNDFTNGVNNVTVTSQVEAGTRMRVTITTVVPNSFGALLGITRANVTRTSVADYLEPIAMGSPCNRFGDDPDALPGIDGRSCSEVRGKFWGVVQGPQTLKTNGDAYQAGKCEDNVDGCTDGVNADYQPDGHLFRVHVPAGLPSLTIEAFDPILTNVGDTCNDHLAGATSVSNRYVPAADAARRYAPGTSNPYCNQDYPWDWSKPASTEFTVRSPGASLWDPLSFPVVPGCQLVFPSYYEDLTPVLDSRARTYRDDIAATFRRWVPLCTLNNPVAGDYLIQVRSNELGHDDADMGNSFSLRAYAPSGNPGNDEIAIFGLGRMSLHATFPGAATEFHLARLPSGAAGHTLNISLFDVGDSSDPGTIRVVAPPDSDATFTGCITTGPVSGPAPSCSLVTDPSSLQGKWEVIQVPIPADYQCEDADVDGCWVRLDFDYGTGSQPHDTTSWTASLDGDPIRLVE